MCDQCRDINLRHVKPPHRCKESEKDGCCGHVNCRNEKEFKHCGYCWCCAQYYKIWGITQIQPGWEPTTKGGWNILPPFWKRNPK